jgi:hypothetical protein
VKTFTGGLEVFTGTGITSVKNWVDFAGSFTFLLLIAGAWTDLFMETPSVTSLTHLGTLATCREQTPRLSSSSGNVSTKPLRNSSYFPSPLEPPAVPPPI